MKPVIIQLEHLVKTYRSTKKDPGLCGALKALINPQKIVVEAVRDISFSIKESEFVGFIGPNGAGKTTTLKMLSGILWPTSGHASVGGHTPWHRKKEMQIQMGIVLGQKNQLWWDLPARDTFLLNKEIYEIPQSEFMQRIAQLGELLGVLHLFDVPVRKLSLGERMKCELVNALLHYPRILFLDEPTIGLDVLSGQSIRAFLKEWNRQQGTTILLTSHSMDDIEELCERVIIIQHGKLSYDGELSSFMEKHGIYKEVTMTFSKKVLRSTLVREGELLSYDPMRVIVRVKRHAVKEFAKHVLDQLPIADISIEETKLEDMIRDLYLDKKKSPLKGA